MSRYDECEQTDEFLKEMHSATKDFAEQIHELPEKKGAWYIVKRDDTEMLAAEIRKGEKAIGRFTKNDDQITFRNGKHNIVYTKEKCGINKLSGTYYFGNIKYQLPESAFFEWATPETELEKALEDAKELANIIAGKYQKEAKIYLDVKNDGTFIIVPSADNAWKKLKKVTKNIDVPQRN